MSKEFVLNFGWVAAAALLGFSIAAFFAGILHLPRSIYLVAYLALAVPFLYGFMRWSNLSIAGLIRHNWIWGLVAAVLIGAFLVRNILSQPVSPRSEGLSLVFDVAWLGIVYGLLDALFLSVLPVLATSGLHSHRMDPVPGWQDPGRRHRPAGQPARDRGLPPGLS